jgi:hypothetical protein
LHWIYTVKPLREILLLAIVTGFPETFAKAQAIALVARKGEIV